MYFSFTEVFKINVERDQHGIHLECKEPNLDFQWGKKILHYFFMGYESLFPFIKNFEVINLSLQYI